MFPQKKDQSFTALISLSNDDLLPGFWQSIILSMPFLWQNSNK